MTLELVPLSQREVAAFVAAHHRHSRPDRGDVIRVGLLEQTRQGGMIVAVASAGRPKAPGLQDGRTLEITRVCTLGHENACSRLYGALVRAGAALGYQRFYTYTLESEPGTSPRAAGFVLDAILEERDWSEGKTDGFGRYAENLLGERQTPAGRKVRWLRAL